MANFKVEFDPSKRSKTLHERGLDFAQATQVFAGRHLTSQDPRNFYGEVRFISMGDLNGRLVVIVWTQRAEYRRIISMRKANEREKASYQSRLGGL